MITNNTSFRLLLNIYHKKFILIYFNNHQFNDIYQWPINLLDFIYENLIFNNNNSSNYIWASSSVQNIYINKLIYFQDLRPGPSFGWGNLSLEILINMSIVTEEITGKAQIQAQFCLNIFIDHVFKHFAIYCYFNSFIRITKVASPFFC